MSYDNPRIDLTDNKLSMLMKMADGNPGALTVLMECMKLEKEIDPDSAFGEIGIGCVLALDTYNIYGSSIWILYKDVCNQNMTDFMGLLRAVQLGIMPESELYALSKGGSIDQKIVADYVAKVKEELPEFGKFSVPA